MDEKIYKIALSQIKTIGTIKKKTLLSVVGSLEKIFTTTETELAEIAKISPQQVKRFKRKKAIKRAIEELKFIEKNGITLHYYQDKDYPSKLKFCSDGPIVLFSKGNIEFNKQNIAIVGMRKASAYGKNTTQELVKELAPRNVQIVSGLAYGIDKEAHESALNNQLSTIAVLGHGFELIYPAAHKSLANRILENGGLITEFLSNSPRDPSNFPKRNRIVAGLCDATVVIESAKKGGSLITANLAFDYNREVFAFPGNAKSVNSAGCNQLIRDLKATLITCAEDMENKMGWKEIEDPNEVVQMDLFEVTSVDENKIISVFQKNKKLVHFDILKKITTMIPTDLSFHLFNLEMKGVVISKPGNLYKIA